MTTATFSQAWTSANRDAWIAQGARACARIYVVIVDKKDRAAARAWAKGNGKIWTGAGGHISHALYVGYDNASGVTHGLGETFAAQLKARGIAAYCDEAMD